MKGRSESEHDTAHGTPHAEKKETRAKKATPKSRATKSTAKTHRKTPQK